MIMQALTRLTDESLDDHHTADHPPFDPVMKDVACVYFVQTRLVEQLRRAFRPSLHLAINAEAFA